MAHLDTDVSEAVDGSDNAALDAFESILGEEDGDPAEELDEEEDSADEGDEPGGRRSRRGRGTG